jgi:hypothetical protein
MRAISGVQLNRRPPYWMISRPVVTALTVVTIVLAGGTAVVSTGSVAIDLTSHWFASPVSDFDATPGRMSGAGFP